MNITFANSAAKQVKKLIELENDDSLKLRIYVEGGGCSGFQYGFKFDTEIDHEDTIIKNNNVILLIDSLSIQYLQGATIDYKEDLVGSAFVITNPSARATCGCGSSFTI